MVAYTLPAKTNATAVREGRRWALLSAPRASTGRQRHARPGEAVQLSTARTSTAASRVLPDAICVFSGLVRFSADGVVRLADQVGEPHGDFGTAMRNLLTAAEQGSAGDRAVPANRVAQACGFKSYADLWASIRGDDGEVIARQVVAWSLV